MPPITRLIILCLVGLFFVATDARGAEIVLKDGRVLRGKLGKVSSLAESPQASKSEGEKLQLILLLDDELRRTFISERLVQEIRQEAARQRIEKFDLRQRSIHSGSSIKTVGFPLRVQPFDEFGRRTYTIASARGPIDVIQGITELTPQWSKVEGISHVWDMRIATSTIPRDTLKKILFKQIDSNDVEACKKVARFYLQSERYEDARRTLEELLKTQADKPELKEQLEPSLRAIRQLSAQQLLGEFKLRSGAGQHHFVSEKIKQFPAEGVGGEILQGVRELANRYATSDARCVDVVRNLETLTANIPETIHRENLKPILDEMAEEIGPNTLDRMAAFLQNADDKQTPDTEKLALAVSGWLLGSDAATTKLTTAISAYKVRGLIRVYLNESDAARRESTYSYIRLESGGNPEMVVSLLAKMKPPVAPPKPIFGKPGYYEIQTPGLPKGPLIKYFIQLPPEYDPYCRYPAVVTLNSAATTPEQQIEWWAGGWSKDGSRNGQAARQGYIVIAPVWTVENQRQYGYSAGEHAAVLNSLRDACRKFSIDTDRVFLSGHSIGGDAVWDIGLAHPDLWAGVIPIVGQSDRYCNLYWENARYVPFYVVAGELDGAKLTKNAKDLDRYMRRGFNTTVVEYEGRGHDDFYDEILQIFDWMGKFHRDFFPREFACETMRAWDNFFWWLEIDGLPPKSQVDPQDWPPPTGSLPMQVKGTINKQNGITVRTGSSRVTVWLSPKMIDFKQRSIITVNGKRLNPTDQMIRPDLLVILEDVRTRGDRQNPFWSRVSGTTGRVYGD